MALDSKVMVEDIRDNNPTVYGAIIHEIVEHRLNFRTCNIGHEFRSSNVEAYKLAEHALSLPAGRDV